jgi:DNA-binding response OmpR family regulator
MEVLVAENPLPPRPFAHEVAINLAHEGVPVRAIARSTKTPGEEIYEILKAAVEDGRLIEIPKDDWPHGSRRERTPAEAAVLGLDEVALQMTCSAYFRLTRLQSAVFTSLIRRPTVTKEQLHQAIENNRLANQDPTDLKMVDVVICHIRKKIKSMGLEVGTIWGIGYSMRPDHRATVMELVHAFMMENAA